MNDFKQLSKFVFKNYTSFKVIVNIDITWFQRQSTHVQEYIYIFLKVIIFADYVNPTCFEYIE